MCVPVPTWYHLLGRLGVQDEEKVSKQKDKYAAECEKMVRKQLEAGRIQNYGIKNIALAAKSKSVDLYSKMNKEDEDEGGADGWGGGGGGGRGPPAGRSSGSTSPRTRLGEKYGSDPEFPVWPGGESTPFALFACPQPCFLGGRGKI